ncbi:alpha/beta fold hydrolase [Alkalihalobacterium elongatum]|uniref:alpha/beta fold hydrolase n=1 Tax=Alkalihalobacterium elongatum TaxID=2675466 RepID=UPI002E2D1BE3|nr:alpha/beta fold hydrolase [Alkalihalobacterium elongatum]
MKNIRFRAREKRKFTNSDALDLKVGQTPRKLVWKLNKASLWYYSAKDKKYETPLLLIYSLVNKSYILDLYPGMSMIEAFLKEGYDVYLLDFGIPGLEDKDLTLDDYILKYMDKAVKRTLRHSYSDEVSLIGYCLGGTLTAIYSAIAKTPIRNVVLFAPPIDFKDINLTKEWRKALTNNGFNLNEIIDEYGIIPAKVMESSLKFATTPFTVSSFLKNSQSKKNDLKTELLYRWVEDQIPFPGATLKQLLNDLVLKNKLVEGELIIKGKKVNLANIRSNILIISMIHDEIVPEEYTQTIMDLLSSEDKLFARIKGGHVSLAMTGKIPNVVKEWLAERSH